MLFFHSLLQTLVSFFTEIVTGIKFSPDCKHLITVCGDRYASLIPSHFLFLFSSNKGVVFVTLLYVIVLAVIVLDCSL